MLAATQKCVSISLSYPVNKTYEPNRTATRADVAASIHQILVAVGRLPALAMTIQLKIHRQLRLYSRYHQHYRARFNQPDEYWHVPEMIAGTGRKPVNAPASGVTTPSAFGANWGDIFLGVGYQSNLPAALAPPVEAIAQFMALASD